MLTQRAVIKRKSNRGSRSREFSRGSRSRELSKELLYHSPRSISRDLKRLRSLTKKNSENSKNRK